MEKLDAVADQGLLQPINTQACAYQKQLKPIQKSFNVCILAIAMAFEAGFQNLGWRSRVLC